MVIAVLFVLFIIISVSAGWYVMGTILFIIGFIIILLIVNSEKNKEEEEDRRRESEDLRLKEIDELNNVVIPAYNDLKNSLFSKYGNPAKVVSFGQYQMEREIIVFEESKRIWICGKDLPMKSILSCTFSDDQKIVKGEITSTTKTDSGNMVKRAVVGDVLLGGAGAIIGGSTAQRTTITTQGDDKVYHNYTVIINIDSISEPIIRINIGADGNLVNEIVGLMNVIINRKFN